jgi:capsule polysaccharide export protein KpsC/LpsZ
MRHLGWRFASRLNARHGLFAWFSLPLVIITDGYIRLLSIGVLADPHVFLFH